MEKRITKKDKFGMIKEILANAEVENKDMLIEFLDDEITRASKVYPKKVKEDTLKDEVLAVVPEEGITLPNIVKTLGREDVTAAKVTSRLKKLIDGGLVTKEVQKRDKTSVTVYFLAKGE